MNEQLQHECQAIANEMRKIAGPVGPMHAWWETICELELAAKGPTIASLPGRQMLRDARRMLNEYSKKL